MAAITSLSSSSLFFNQSFKLLPPSSSSSCSLSFSSPSSSSSPFPSLRLKNRSKIAVKAVAEGEEQTLAAEETLAENVSVPVSPSDRLTMFFKAEGSMDESSISKVSKSLQEVEGISDLKVQIAEGIASVERRGQDILNAINLVGVTKRQLQKLRENEWESFLEEVCEFCKKNEISFPNMDETFVAPGRSRRRAEELTNLHHYRVEIFYAVIDLQLQELNHRFDEINTQLVLCIACLDPRDSFSAFDKVKLLQFAKFYPVDFSPTDLMALSFQLDTYLEDVTRAAEFSNLTGINDLTQKMVQTRRHIVYPLVYLLMKLALLLPVATATCERAFSAMKLIKTSLHNQM